MQPVLTVKRDEQGKVASYKVCLVVQGYTMRKGVNYDKTCSPCACLSTVQIVTSISASIFWIFSSTVQISLEREEEEKEEEEEEDNEDEDEEDDIKKNEFFWNTFYFLL